MRTFLRVSWALPTVWCAIATAIIALGLQVPLGGGIEEAGFSYVLGVASHRGDFMQNLALYSIASAVLALGFTLGPRLASWRINRLMAWSTLMLMAVGGILMLAVPQFLVAMTQGANDSAWSLAQMWSVTWMEAGERISLAGALVGLATFLDAWMRRAG